MFDIGFLELLLISIIGLMVLGPEKLPGAIRTGSLWIGRLKRSFNNVRAEIEKEVGADEIRRQLHNEAIMDSLKESSSAFGKEVSTAKDKLQELDHQLGNIVNDDSIVPTSAESQESANTLVNTSANIDPDTQAQKPKSEQA